MKRFVLVVLLAVLCIFGAFASYRAGVSYAFSGTEEDSGRISVDIGDRYIWQFGKRGERKVAFSLLLDGGGSVSFTEYNNEPHVHLDIYFSLMPGASFIIEEDLFLNVAAGVRYGRIGYAGNIDTANDWDKTLSVITLSLMGSHPLRKVDAVLDVSFKAAFASFGVQVGYPILQGQTDKHQTGFAGTAFVALDFK